MNKIAKALWVLVVLTLVGATPLLAQTTRYVETAANGGSDAAGANTCAVATSPCLTMTQAVTKADIGDIIDVGPGLFVESVSIEKGVTLACNQANVPVSGRTFASPAETTIAADGATGYAVQIRNSNVTVNGCSIGGAPTAYAGIQIWNSGTAAEPNDISNISIKNNFISYITDANPNATFNYAYGIFGMGGGSESTKRGKISGLSITGNNIDIIGGACTVCNAGAFTGGVGIYLKSIYGATAGDGLTITGNSIDALYDGVPSSTSAALGAATESGVAVVVLEDDYLAVQDRGALISGNTFDPDADGDVYGGVAIQMTASDVSQNLASFGDGDGTDIGDHPDVAIVNFPHPSFGSEPLAEIDLSNLSPIFVSKQLSFTGVVTPVVNATGYFLSMFEASSASATGATVSPAPVDNNFDGAKMSLSGTSVVYTFGSGPPILVPIADFVALGVVPGISGTPANETITVTKDLLLALGAAGLPLNIDLGAGTDDLVLESATADEVDHTLYNENDGKIEVIDAAVTGTLNYTGLDPITDNLIVATRVFTFTGGAETITLGDEGTTGNGISRIDSDLGELIDFVNPTVGGTLTINAGTGADVLNIGALDGVPAITVVVNGDTGADTFNVTPAATGYTLFTVNGGSPSACPGDVLNIDTSGGAVIGALSPAVTFTSAHTTVNYTGIEALANLVSDISVEVSAPLFPGDQVAFTITVTNNGPDTAQCVVITDAVKALTFTTGPVLSNGFISGNDWIITSIPADGTETLSGTVFVNTSQSVTIVGSTSSTDANSSNDSAVLIGTAFKFPAKAHPQAALVYEFTISGVTFERLIVGLFQGSPGRNSAVLCRVPEPDGVVFSVNPAFVKDVWRECGTGLPYPLHVNDLWYDEDTDRIWLASWGSAGLYYSDNGGFTWTASEPDLENQPTGWKNVYGITKDADDILYISANNGLVFRSLDSGVNWTQVSSLPLGAADNPWTIVADPVAAGTIYAGTGGNGVWVSDDYGNSWEAVGGVTVNEQLKTDGGGWIFDLEFSPDDPTVLFAGTARNVWKIDLDGALLWEQFADVTLPDPPGTTVVTPEARGLAFADTADLDDRLYVAYWGFGVYEHDDPLGSLTAFEEFSLRGVEVTFVSVKPNGDVLAGTNGNGFYEIKSATATSTEPGAGSLDLPSEYTLSQNYPNPFNPVTTIEFGLPEAAHVSVTVYDMLGRTVARLADGPMSAGTHRVTFDAAGLPTGTYLYRLETPVRAISQIMVLLK